MSAVMNRIGFIGGSDARRIIEGDWLSLYEEKVGIRASEDLSGVFRVQLGKWTEPFHAGWLNDQMGVAIDNPQSVYIHPGFPWMRGTVDGWLRSEDTFIELKHTNERATVRSMTDQYLPQVAHYCLCTGRSHGFLSFIAGNQDPVIAKIEPSAGYLTELESLEQSFWWHVENREAPDAAPSMDALAKEAAKVRVNGLRFVDMTGNNAWAAHASQLLMCADAARSFEEAKDELKALVEADVAEASGHGVTIKRDKRGALRFTIKED